MSASIRSSKWISADQELPKDFERTLLRTNLKGNPMFRAIFCGKAFVLNIGCLADPEYPDAYKMRYVSSGNEKEYENLLKRITHWMPEPT